MEPHIIERRKHGSSEVLELVRLIHDNQLALDKKLSDHMREETLQLAEEIARLLNSCFPNGDAQGHKLHHELLIQQEQRRVAFWSKMSEELTKYGLIGFMGWAAWALWQAFLQGPHK